MRNCGKIKRKKTKLDRMMDRLVIIVSVVQTPPALVHRPPGVAHKSSLERLLAWVMLIFLSLRYFAQNILALTCYGQIPSDVLRKWQLLGLEQSVRWLCCLNPGRWQL